MRTGTPILVAALVLLAGCAGPDEGAPGPASAASSSAAGVPAGYGDVAGRVHNDELVPIAGATATLGGTGESVETDAEGAFSFSHLPEGVHDVQVGHGDYVPRTVSAEVRAGETTQVDVTLTLLEDRRPHNETLHRAGYFDCGMELPIYTGDCVPTGTYVGPDPVTHEEYAFFFTAASRWTHIVLELHWNGGASNQLDGMHLYLSPGNETDLYGHHTKMAVAEGNENPLRLVVTNGEVHPTAEYWEETQTKAMVPATGGPLQVLVYPRGKLADAFGQVCTQDGRCFLGIGAGLNVEFEVFITTFYNGPVPDGFSAVPS